MNETKTCAAPKPILLYIIGRRDRPVQALEAMHQARLRGYEPPDWLRMEEMHMHEGLPKADLMKNLKRALDSSVGGILIDPARENGAAEAAYLAGQGKPVVAWLTEGAPTARVEVLHELIGNWSHENLDRCFDYMAELRKGEKRPGS